jgi:hypothetical protein
MWNCKNPKVKPSFKQWWNELMCKWFGHRTTGYYYGMPQAHCQDCGYINKGIASDKCQEWSEPH